MKFKISLLIFLGFVLFCVVQIPQIRQIFPNFTLFKNSKSKTLTREDLQNLPNFEVGDLIFRLGDEFDSLLIARISDFRYSHIGVVIDTAPLTILHATVGGGETDKENGAVIKSSFDEFLAHARKIGVARINFLTQTQKNELVQNLKAKLGEKFILAKSTEPNLYCTTLIEREIFKIYPNFTPKYTQINAPIFNGLYLTPKAFLEYDGVEILYESW
ncbi:YiiX/YebB-like N1pC/P60 family cysteine hydrolase [Campylobacter sp. CN_NA1]|uniref:YiiX/YebB-like N1pC/P60 family cysteine hydrolase n=1 Tax=Campylobacter sp. CN_NA1 TaxID=2984150 RepID=UPI0022E9DEF7|nr:YiiX/YebB-like N1pC/P60 family cysteine hydrolase [Campylobacter sp. CN_NA1]MDA3055835.1 YiiX/YebB-like N1pC/P60 family cysteine hydrolase [Campylobacter sp. CN_NA1]